MLKMRERRYAKWYDFEYYVRKIPEAWKKSWEKARAPKRKMPFDVTRKIIPRKLRKISDADYQLEPEIIHYEYGMF